MIIQCEKCQTRFRLDDSRVKDKGVKVRCTKCKNVFRVQKDVTEEEPLAPLFAAEAVQEASFNSETLENYSVSNVPTDLFSFETTSFDDSDTPIDAGNHIVTDSEEIPVSAAKPADVTSEADFSSFDFGECNSESDSTMQSTLSIDDFTDVAVETAATLPKKEIPQGLDFSDDDMFGEVAQTTPEATGEAITFDFGGDSFAESIQMSGQDSSRKSGNLLSASTPVDTSFNLGEIDFGDELTSVAVQQVNPDDLKPSQEILFAPIIEAQDKTAGDNTFNQPLSGENLVADQYELPPLSISSRRKPNPFFGAVVGAISVMVISIIGYVAYLGYSSSVSTTKESGVLESGKISVKGVKAVFIENDEAGELLVISGEALNEYSKERAALQVKVTVFDSAGQSIASKSAYGGNPLTEEQLESLQLEKIEAAMANQFGDSLANMEVAPGKSIPFVVVIANLPKGAKDFAVESAGSTVATGKQ